MARSGLTTGTCATAATCAAAQLLLGHKAPAHVQVVLPHGRGLVELSIANSSYHGICAQASVIKDAGDDPDVTHGLIIEVQLQLLPNATEHKFIAGPGVGTITRPGLSFPIGEPAINPVPRQMIAQVLAQAGLGPCQITITVPQGAEVAARTFNPRLGIVGGISILGTTGIVRPYCRKAMCDAIRVNLQVVRAQSEQATLVPGNIGYRSAQQYWNHPIDTLVEVGNEWQAGLQAARQCHFTRLYLIGHPGKLAKLAMGEFYTHSHHSSSALPYVLQLAHNLDLQPNINQATVEGLFTALSPSAQTTLAQELIIRIAQGVLDAFSDPTTPPLPSPEVHLIRMDGTPLL